MGYAKTFILLKMCELNDGGSLGSANTYTGPLDQFYSVLGAELELMLRIWFKRDSHQNVGHTHIGVLVCTEYVACE